MKAIGFILLLLAKPALAQIPGGGDNRYLTIGYAQGIVQLPTSPGTSQIVLFAGDERIQSVILSDPNSYLVTVAGSGNSLTLRANGRPMPVMMSVRTELRSYEIELVLAGVGAAPQVIRFSYGATESESQPPAPPPQMLPDVTYRLSGSKGLRPVSIGDDGDKTYIAWRDDQAMPAVFAIGPAGTEEMVNGYVRAGVFTIDRVFGELVFRIDRQTAKARREPERTRGQDD